MRVAIIEEFDDVSQECVWKASDYEEMKGTKDSTLVRMRWVQCNKGDATHLDVRARLAAREFAKDKQSQFYASTPPLEAKTWLFSQYAKKRMRKGQHSQLSFVDVKKAYFYGEPKRAISMSPPRELGLPKSLLVKQTKCVYGTMDAGMIWEETYRAALERMGFRLGKGCPFCFHHEERGLSLVVHGDDLTVLGLSEDLNWYEEQLAKSFKLEIHGRLEENTEPKEMRILNRVITITKKGVQYEADPRHAELMIQNFSLGDSKGVKTPGVKPTDWSIEATKEGAPEP